MILDSPCGGGDAGAGGAAARHVVRAVADHDHLARLDPEEPGRLQDGLRRRLGLGDVVTADEVVDRVAPGRAPSGRASALSRILLVTSAVPSPSALHLADHGHHAGERHRRARRGGPGCSRDRLRSSRRGAGRRSPTSPSTTRSGRPMSAISASRRGTGMPKRAKVWAYESTMSGIESSRVPSRSKRTARNTGQSTTPRRAARIGRPTARG